MFIHKWKKPFLLNFVTILKWWNPDQLSRDWWNVNVTSSIINTWTGSVCVSVGGRERAWDIIPDEIGWYRQGTKIQKVSDIGNHLYHTCILSKSWESDYESSSTFIFRAWFVSDNRGGWRGIFCFAVVDLLS